MYTHALIHKFIIPTSTDTFSITTLHSTISTSFHPDTHPSFHLISTQASNAFDGSLTALQAGRRAWQALPITGIVALQTGRNTETKG